MDGLIVGIFQPPLFSKNILPAREHNSTSMINL